MPDLYALNLTDNPTFCSIKKLIGEEKASLLSYEFGGRSLYIPKKIGEHHPITATIGLAEAKKICETWGGLDYEVPFTTAKVLRATALRKDGASITQIAIRLTMSERHVYRLFEKQSNQSSQPSLF